MGRKWRSGTLDTVSVHRLMTLPLFVRTFWVREGLFLHGQQSVPSEFPPPIHQHGPSTSFQYRRMRLFFLRIKAVSVERESFGGAKKRCAALICSCLQQKPRLGALWGRMCLNSRTAVSVECSPPSPQQFLGSNQPWLALQGLSWWGRLVAPNRHDFVSDHQRPLSIPATPASNAVVRPLPHFLQLLGRHSESWAT